MIIIIINNSNNNNELKGEKFVLNVSFNFQITIVIEVPCFYKLEMELILLSRIEKLQWKVKVWEEA